MIHENPMASIRADWLEYPWSRIDQHPASTFKSGELENSRTLSTMTYSIIVLQQFPCSLLIELVVRRQFHTMTQSAA